MEEIRTRTSIFQVDKYGIVHKQVIEGVNVTPEDVDEDQEMMLKLQGRKKSIVLVNAMVFHTMTPEAIEKLKYTMIQSRYATAMVSHSLGVRIFVDTLTILLKKKNVFIDMFPTEEEAVKWLLSVKKQAEKPLKHIPKSKKIRTKEYEVRMDNKGIVHRTIFRGSHIDMNIARRSEKSERKLAGNKKVLALIDRRANYTITPEAIKNLRKTATSKHRIATALVSAKPYKVNTRPAQGKPPIKVFTNKATAIKWLLSVKRTKDTLRDRNKL